MCVDDPGHTRRMWARDVTMMCVTMRRMTMKQRTSTYVETVYGDTQRIRDRIAEVRREVNRSNRSIREGSKETGTKPIQFFVRARGRLGPNNPNADLYRVGGPRYRHRCLDIDLDHSTRADIYIGVRSRHRS